MQKIPVTIITGFLGAGKTTLLQYMLQHNQKRRLALIINEFGKTGIDGELIQACQNNLCTTDDIIELANGCICCTVADDFIPTINQLLSRSTRPDHIIIETSGLALPKPLVAAFNWPEIRTCLTVDGVITVVDGVAALDPTLATIPTLKSIDSQKIIQHDNPIHELFRDQIACADLIILNKTDLQNNNQINQVQKLLDQHRRSQAKIITARFGQVPSDILLGIGAHAESNINQRLSHHDQHPEEDHGHAEFKSFSLKIPKIDCLERYIENLYKVLDQPGVLRLKGFSAVKGKTMRLIVQGVGGRLQHYYDRPLLPEEDKDQGVLVVIGDKSLEEHHIHRYISF